jgi:hypothetical protein
MHQKVHGYRLLRLHKHNNSTIKKIATTGLLKASLLPFTSPTRIKNGRTILIIMSTYATASPIVYNALAKSPALTIAITTASIHHAVMSSAAAQVIAIAPSLLFAIPFLV